MDKKKEIAKYILKLLQEERLEKDIAVNILKKLKDEREDIAIIGMGCKFAQINNHEELPLSKNCMKTPALLPWASLMKLHKPNASSQESKYLIQSGCYQSPSANPHE